MSDAIDALLKAWQEELRHDEPDEMPSEGLLCTGNLLHSVPCQLLLDPLLSPRDKLAWQILRLHASSRDGTVFPSYSALQRLLTTSPATECASRSTVSQCLTMLRLTRWLSLCQRVRDKTTGRNLGNIYALHDSPLTLLNAHRLDSGYLQFLSDCIQHRCKSVRLTAQAITQSLKDDPAQRYLVSRLEHLEAGVRLSHQAAESSHSTRDAPGTVTGLSEQPSAPVKGSADNSAGCPLVLCQDPGHVLNTVKRKISSTQQQWPENLSLTSAQRGAVWQAMAELPEQLRQEVLDNCSRRIAAGSIRNPLGYILATLNKAKRGEFNLLKRQKPSHQRRTPIRPEATGSTLADNLKYLCQHTRKRHPS